MPKVEGRPKIELRVDISLSEPEARAIDALAGYGDDSFIAAFYEHLGEAYLKPHEAGLREFLKTVRSFMPNVLSRIDNARKAFGP